MRFHKAILIIILTFNISLGTALKCVHCNGFDEECTNDSENHSFLEVKQCENLNYDGILPVNFLPNLDVPFEINSTDDTFYCVKINIQSVYSYRSCAKGNAVIMQDFCFNINDPDVACGVCTKDMCNASAQTTQAIFLAALLPIINYLNNYD